VGGAQIVVPEQDTVEEEEALVPTPDRAEPGVFRGVGHQLFVLGDAAQPAALVAQMDGPATAAAAVAPADHLHLAAQDEGTEAAEEPGQGNGPVHAKRLRILPDTVAFTVFPPAFLDLSPQYAYLWVIMNWDWDKLQKQQQGRPGGKPPSFDDFQDQLEKLKKFKLPGWKLVIPLLILLWIASGFYIVEPDEVGVVKQFGKFNRITTAGPNYHIPYPVESVLTPKVTQIRRVEFGFRSVGRPVTQSFQQGVSREVKEESLMLTGDENIVSVQFIVQYMIKDAENYLFNVNDPEQTLAHAGEAAMREVIGNGKIDDALTTGKQEIQVQTRELMQRILDNYRSGLSVVAVQMQNVHPPDEVIEAFKDVASAREDKSRYINEAEAYQRDILPKARGEASRITNSAQAYKETKIRGAEGDAARFLAVLKEYNKARDITRKRLYLETMEAILSNPDADKLIMSDDALKQSVPYLPLDKQLRKAAPKEGK
jgi:membrane protease subunit HflK